MRDVVIIILARCVDVITFIVDKKRLRFLNL